MKNLLTMMVIVSAMILSTLTSCNKDDSLADNGSGERTSMPPTTLNLTTYRWESTGGGVFINTFMNVIPAVYANRWVKIYLIANGAEILINRPIRFMDGALWAASTVTDIRIFYRGNLENSPNLNIKVVFE